jgi:tRNA splicing ligase
MVMYDTNIVLLLLDQQSVEKRSLHLMDTVNAKKRWKTISWRFTLTESHIVTRLANERASFLNMNDINDISFLERLTVIIVVL